MHRAEAWKGMAMSERASARIDRDDLLVKALQRREPAAAELLVTTYSGRAYRLASGIAGNAQDAEEVVQDAFWTVVRRIDTFRGESAFGSWFYRIVANAAYQKLRHRPGRRSEISLDEVLPVFHENGQHAAPIADWSSSVHDPSRQTELRMALTTAIDELPLDYRTALIFTMLKVCRMSRWRSRWASPSPMRRVARTGPDCFSESASGASCRTRRLGSRLHLRSNGASFGRDALSAAATLSRRSAC